MILLVLSILLIPFHSHARMPAPVIEFSKYSTQCKVQVLKNIGWQIEKGQADAVIAAERCESISAPKLVMQGEASTITDEALRSTGTNCLYQNRIAIAALAATKKLKSNKFYIFPPFWQNALLSMGSLKKTWQVAVCANEENQCYNPNSEDKAKSIDAFYTSPFSTDCSVGLQLAEYAMIKELFGNEMFNKHFSTDEIFLGEFPDSAKSKSFTRGKHKEAVWAEKGSEYSKAGFRTFIGVPGVIASVFDESFLDDIPNVNENFMIVDITQAASESFERAEGFKGYENKMREIWELTKSITKPELKALQDVAEINYLNQASEFYVQSRMSKELDQPMSATSMKILKLLKDPFLSQTQIYVHPVGNRNIAWHILRLAQINSRTPYKIAFHQEVVHGGLFNRWIKSQLDDCENN
ncbi:MAG: hypothetical protein H7061_04430 [Bdellovibrionaceae bacterium]|nr:hypothetical protein [Bdellovibrio sp.]